MATVPAATAQPPESIGLSCPEGWRTGPVAASRQFLTLHYHVGFAALRRHEERHFRLWEWARHIAHNNYVHESDLIAYAQMDKRTVRRLLRHTGWFRTARRRIYLRGLAFVCDRLGAGPQHAESDMDWHSIGDFRAAILKAFCTAPVTISNRTLAGMSNRSRQTIISWVKRAGLGREANVMLSRLASLTPEHKAQGYHHDRIAGATAIVKHMPNTYRATPCHSWGRRTRLYARAEDAHKAIESLRDGEQVYVPTGKRTDGGAVVWQRWQRLGSLWLVS